MEAVLESKFYVVQFKNESDANAHGYVCVPRSWIRTWTSSKNRLCTVAYPTENAKKTKNRVNRQEKISKATKIYVAFIKYETDDYAEAKSWIAANPKNARIEKKSSDRQSEGQPLPTAESKTPRHKRHETSNGAMDKPVITEALLTTKSDSKKSPKRISLDDYKLKCQYKRSRIDEATEYSNKTRNSSSESSKRNKNKKVTCHHKNSLNLETFLSSSDLNHCGEWSDRIKVTSSLPKEECQTFERSHEKQLPVIIKQEDTVTDTRMDDLKITSSLLHKDCHPPKLSHEKQLPNIQNSLFVHKQEENIATSDNVSSSSNQTYQPLIWPSLLTQDRQTVPKCTLEEQLSYKLRSLFEGQYKQEENFTASMDENYSNQTDRPIICASLQNQDQQTIHERTFEKQLSNKQRSFFEVQCKLDEDEEKTSNEIRMDNQASKLSHEKLLPNIQDSQLQVQCKQEENFTTSNNEKYSNQADREHILVRFQKLDLEEHERIVDNQTCHKLDGTHTNESILQHSLTREKFTQKQLQQSLENFKEVNSFDIRAQQENVTNLTLAVNNFSSSALHMACATSPPAAEKSLERKTLQSGHSINTEQISCTFQKKNLPDISNKFCQSAEGCTFGSPAADQTPPISKNEIIRAKIKADLKVVDEYSAVVEEMLMSLTGASAKLLLLRSVLMTYAKSIEK